jgi:hypothetical protein
VQRGAMKVDDPVPSGAAMYASRMFHSSGTVQSNTLVPLGISVRRIGICSSSRSKVARTPLRVRLRQSGNIRRASW